MSRVGCRIDPWRKEEPGKKDQKHGREDGEGRGKREEGRGKREEGRGDHTMKETARICGSALGEVT